MQKGKEREGRKKGTKTDGGKLISLTRFSSRVIKRDVDRDNPTRINYIHEGLLFSLEEKSRAGSVSKKRGKKEEMEETADKNGQVLRV